MTDERTEPPLVAGERDMLDTWLDWHRATLAIKCAGLNDDQLREPSVPPSELTLLGLVRHMAEVELGWFGKRVGGLRDPWHYCDDDTNPEGDFRDVATADVSEALATWRKECDRSRDIAAAVPSLDATFAGTTRRYSLRWIMVHMIEEYARHNGHADLLRERIDGATGD